MYKKRNAILQHPLFLEQYRLIEGDEQDRCFCRHDINHLLDVARIATLLNYKETYQLSEASIYAAALLHDIGRHAQYACGTDHADASAKLAATILGDCHFSAAQIEEITAAIKCHRHNSCAKERNLAALLYRADKMSRRCFMCEAAPLCNWPREKKRHNLVY